MAKEIKKIDANRNKIRIAAVSALGLCAVVGATLEPLGGVASGYMGLGGAAAMLLPGVALVGISYLYFKLFQKYVRFLRSKPWKAAESDQPVPMTTRARIWVILLLAPPLATIPIWLPIVLEFTTSLNVFSTLIWPWIKAIENLGFIAGGILTNPLNLILALSIGTVAGAFVTAVFLLTRRADQPLESLGAYDLLDADTPPPISSTYASTPGLQPQQPSASPCSDILAGLSDFDSGDEGDEDERKSVKPGKEGCLDGCLEFLFGRRKNKGEDGGAGAARDGLRDGRVLIPDGDDFAVPGAEKDFLEASGVPYKPGSGPSF